MWTLLGTPPELRRARESECLVEVAKDVRGLVSNSGAHDCSGGPVWSLWTICRKSYRKMSFSFCYVQSLSHAQPSINFINTTSSRDVGSSSYLLFSTRLKHFGLPWDIQPQADGHLAVRGKAIHSSISGRPTTDSLLYYHCRPRAGALPRALSHGFDVHLVFISDRSCIFYYFRVIPLMICGRHKSITSGFLFVCLIFFPSVSEMVQNTSGSHYSAWLRMESAAEGQPRGTKIIV